MFCQALCPKYAINDWDYNRSNAMNGSNSNSTIKGDGSNNDVTTMFGAKVMPMIMA